MHAFNTFLLSLKQSFMANSAKRRKWPAAVGVDEYDDYISLSSGITIVLQLVFIWVYDLTEVSICDTFIQVWPKEIFQ